MFKYQLFPIMPQTIRKQSSHRECFPLEEPSSFFVAFDAFLFLPSLILPYLFCFFNLHSQLTSFFFSTNTLNLSLLREKYTSAKLSGSLYIRLLEGITDICCLFSSYLTRPWTLTTQLLHHLFCDTVLLETTSDPPFSRLCLHLPLISVGKPRRF